jgi:enoyl-CoA hydratase/carnithine racemase
MDLMIIYYDQSLIQEHKEGKEMDLPDIIYHKSPPLAFITLNRAETRNAFTREMMDSLYRALDDARKDPEIKVIILGGRGEAFCAGANIKDMAEGKFTAWDMKHFLWDHVQRIPLLLEEVDKPVIASIGGPAYGAGFDLALACDLRIASEKATFCSAFIRIGLVPGDGGVYFLPRLVGLSKALEILMTGRVIKMDEALRIGLADRVVPAEDLEQETKSYAMEMAEWPLEPLSAIKRSVYSGLRSDLRGHLDSISSQQALLTQTEEHREAVKKLVEPETK